MEITAHQLLPVSLVTKVGGQVILLPAAAGSLPAATKWMTMTGQEAHSSVGMILLLITRTPFPQGCFELGAQCAGRNLYLSLSPYFISRAPTLPFPPAYSTARPSAAVDVVSAGSADQLAAHPTCRIGNLGDRQSPAKESGAQVAVRADYTKPAECR